MASSGSPRMVFLWKASCGRTWRSWLTTTPPRERPSNLQCTALSLSRTLHFGQLPSLLLSLKLAALPTPPPSSSHSRALEIRRWRPPLMNLDRSSCPLTLGFQIGLRDMVLYCDVSLWTLIGDGWRAPLWCDELGKSGMLMFEILNEISSCSSAVISNCGWLYDLCFSLQTYLSWYFNDAKKSGIK